MQTIYWAHSYRPEDATINEYFGMLIRQAGNMIPNFDPPSDKVNESKLLHNLWSCDGMIAVLPVRKTGPSPYILFEISLALRARKPVIVFIDDRIRGDVLPPGVLQRRYSSTTYFRQVREHVHALHVLKAHMGEPPPPKYESGTKQRCCGVVGGSHLGKEGRTTLVQFLEERAYKVIHLENVETRNPLHFTQYEELADVGVAVLWAHARSAIGSFWRGMIKAAAIPSIELTNDSSHPFSPDFPIEFQPRIVDEPQAPTMGQVLNAEFELFEQTFLSARDPKEIERYVSAQIDANVRGGRYQANTRQEFVSVIMGNQNNNFGQAVVVGDDANVQGNSIQQVWNEIQSGANFPSLQKELDQLQKEMEKSASGPEEKIAVHAVAAAQDGVEKQDGSKVVKYLKIAGQWAFEVATKLGIEVAADAIKKAMISP